MVAIDDRAGDEGHGGRQRLHYSGAPPRRLRGSVIVQRVFSEEKAAFWRQTTGGLEGIADRTTGEARGEVVKVMSLN